MCKTILKDLFYLLQKEIIINELFSYSLILKLFFLIAAYQLELLTTAYRLLLKNFEVEYLELVNETGFKRFSLPLLKKYF